MANEWIFQRGNQMDPFAVLFVYVLISGSLGSLGQFYIGAFRTASQSIDSPNLATMIWYRYLLFSLMFGFSFFLSPALANRFANLWDGIPKTALNGTIIMVVISLPLAILLFWLDCKYLRWAEKKTAHARGAIARRVIDEHHKRHRPRFD